MDSVLYTLPQVAPIEDLLQNNHPPGPAERARLRELLQELRQKEAALETLFNEVSTRRAECASYTEGVLKALAPCRTVPQDVWALVFAFVPEQCWEVSWVCREWRNVALSMPSLWTNLPKIGFPTASPTAFLSRLRLHAERSGTRPLIVSKMRLPLALGFRIDDLEDFLTIFYAMVPRIGRITVEAPTGWTPTDLTFLSMVPQRFEQLSAVTFVLQQEIQPRTSFGTVSMFQSCPNLSKMVFDLCSTKTQVTNWFQIPWSNFKTLDVGWMSVQDFYKILNDAPHLLRLTAWTDFSADNMPPHQSIKHDLLQHLLWTSKDPTVSLDLSLIDIPKARMLFLHSFRSQQWVTPLPAPSAAIANSSRIFPHLTRLFIGSIHNGDPHALVDFLRCAPALGDLWVAWFDQIEVVFEALSTPTSTEGSFLVPSLSHLRVFGVPRNILATATPLTWRTSVSQFALQRGSKSDKARLDLVLSVRGRCDPDVVGKLRSRALPSLNRLAADQSSAGDPGDDSCKQIQRLVAQISASSDKVDDLVCRCSTCLLK